MLAMLWRKRNLLHCHWEYKLVQLQWRTVWNFLKKLKIVTVWSSNPIPTYISGENANSKRYVHPNVHESERKVKVKSLSGVWFFATPWTVAHQALPSMGFSRQEYWSGLPLPSPGDLPDPNPGLPHWGQMLYPLSHQGIPMFIAALFTIARHGNSAQQRMNG